MSAEDSTNIDYENHPVFSVLFRLCGNYLTQHTVGDLSQCPGMTTSYRDGRRCTKNPSKSIKEIDAQIMVLVNETSFRYEDADFRERINVFFKATHCWQHWEFPRKSFTAWIKDQKCTTQQLETDTHPDLGMDEETKDGPLSSGSENDGVTEELSSLSISPSQESEISFGSMSDADTALTTPDATPLIQVDQILSFDPESRSETPCPAPRIPCDSDEEVEGPNNDNGEVPPLEDANMMDAKLLRRRTLMIGKISLLRAIHHGWTARDSEEGKVYIWTHNQHSDIIKIGWSASARGSVQRHAQPGNCYGINTTPLWESPEAFVGAYRVEQIVQKQLQEANTAVECGSSKCVARHREWFRCDTEEAKTQIMLWTRLLAEGFYERCGDGDPEAGHAAGMRISAKGNRVLTQLCAVSPANLLQGLLKDIPDETTASMKEVQSSEENDGFVFGIDDQLPLSVDGCAGRRSPADNGSEPRGHASATDLSDRQSYRNGSIQEPHIPVPEREDGPPRPGKVSRFMKRVRRSLGRHDVETKPPERPTTALERGDGASGGVDLDSRHEEETVRRLCFSIFNKDIIKFESTYGPVRKST
ncbi:hypothetical protein PG988_006817 [Apiospora saccharicola]